MKTLSMLVCLFLTGFGAINAWLKADDINDFAANSFIMIIGALSFLIITWRTEKRPDYDKNHWMNK